uniref:Uncharacterized protein n=1 Tax=Candidatus Kentrum sp. TUN TaxID=2126343 RepID=A0A451AL04_9GAMM|nr:MAG: hypothetical protein BECKTUN1418D_GA0071000_100817 [Candidatus Kentron sp. TUN]VFK57870.1 MAG: hypothetical protein BECKTUN1418F_GA0071002_11285 [Candidatus Kentron sp. TUN]VFK66706.1 MAG: hypothetical protein BECKTUN1418E_GA0071001_11245 [Candidatus Kentron sp. TUN]
MDRRDPKLKEIWKQEKIPVVFRKGKSEPLLIHLPYAQDNWWWLKGEHRNQPEWIENYNGWKTPKAWFEDVIKRTLGKYGSVYVIQPYRTQQKCAPACWNATGVECECSCMGENHGAGNPGGKWHVVSETFAVKWDERQYSCRLILPNPA